jgi:hypothetical protein
MRCEDAFNEFWASATIMITQGENRRIAYKTSTAYARFVQHLYEFMLGAIKRDHWETGLSQKMADILIASHAQRVVTNKRNNILNGTAPAWENDISYYPEKIPKDFAKKFGQVRNKLSVHVTHERPSLNLTDFYDKYHKYLWLLYQESKNGIFRSLGDEFPDLDEITAFSVLVKKKPPQQP